jgi:hypothetical protein
MVRTPAPGRGIRRTAAGAGEIPADRARYRGIQVLGVISRV